MEIKYPDSKESLLNYIHNNCDIYFKNVSDILLTQQNIEVIYAVFMRSNVIPATAYAENFIKHCNKVLGYNIEIIKPNETFLSPEEPLMYLKGNYSEIAMLETLILQLIGLPSVCAINAYNMCKSMPWAEFIAMEARHCPGIECQYLSSYGASLGSQLAEKEGAKGFVATSVQNSANLFSSKKALGTMPHGFIGCFDTPIEAAIAFYNHFKPDTLTALIDYNNKEVTESIEIGKHFKSLESQGKLYIRVDTHSATYLEGLNDKKSKEIINQHVPNLNLLNCSAEESKHLFGKGTSLAAMLHLKNSLADHGLHNIKIVASSGFSPAKCAIFGKYNAPVSKVGTGSFLPKEVQETFATADIISYNGSFKVKKGRESLIKTFQTLCSKIK